MSVTTMPVQDSWRLIDQLAQNAEIGLYILSLRGEQPACEFANAAWCRWCGTSIQELQAQQKHWITCFHPEDRVRMQQLYLKVLLTGCSEKAEYRLYCPSKEIVYVVDTLHAVQDTHGFETTGVCGCAQDISSIKNAREEMQRTQLLQNLGSLMAGIAHEINTPLQFIGDNLQFLSDAWQSLSKQLNAFSEGLEQLQRQPGPAQVESFLHDAAAIREKLKSGFLEDEFPKAVRQSLEGIERLTKLVWAMRDFSHLEDRRQAPADINRAVTSALTLLHNELKYICDVETQLDPSLPEITCSIDEMNRVLLNLLVNAAHSIAEKIERGNYQRGRIRVGTQAQSGGLRIFIQDDGTGIPKEIQHRMFERFFTTKRSHPDRRGTGQGLHMAHQTVVDHHHGSLTFETQPGQGTTFYIFLPFTPNTQEEVKTCASC
ncbi:MAG: PAS domain-containing protein [Planctomycetaceae bacterium]|nr:PAS domain-containing protein [Planctomycetaceae bacterium]